MELSDWCAIHLILIKNDRINTKYLSPRDFYNEEVLSDSDSDSDSDSSDSDSSDSSQ